jgi:hypothetical protein
MPIDMASCHQAAGHRRRADVHRRAAEALEQRRGGDRPAGQRDHHVAMMTMKPSSTERLPNIDGRESAAEAWGVYEVVDMSRRIATIAVTYGP